MKKIKTLENILREDQIKGVIQSKDKEVNIVGIGKVYYPYCKLSYKLKMGKGLTALDTNFLCVVDLVTGRESMGDGEPNLIEIVTEKETVMAPELETARITEIGHDYVLKILLSKLKMLHMPNILLEETAVFHKPFYIVNCKDKKENDYCIMVDSVDGQIAIIDH